MRFASRRLSWLHRVGSRRRDPRFGSCASRTAGTASPPLAWGSRSEQDPVRSAQGRAVQSWGPAKVQDAPTASKAACWGPAEPEMSTLEVFRGLRPGWGHCKDQGREQCSGCLLASRKSEASFLLVHPRTDPSPAVTSHFFFSI